MKPKNHPIRPLDNVFSKVEVGKRQKNHSIRPLGDVLSGVEVGQGPKKQKDAMSHNHMTTHTKGHPCSAINGISE